MSRHVFVALVEYDYEPSHFLGVFETEKGAIAALRDHAGGRLRDRRPRVDNWLAWGNGSTTRSVGRVEVHP